MKRGLSMNKQFIGFLVGLGVCLSAGATIPEPPNPLNNLNLTFDQRLEQRKQIDEQLLKATPEERKAY